VGRFPGGQETERGIAFDFFFECKFGPWQQTDSHARLGRIRKAPRYRIGKLGRDQPVPDSCGSGRYVVKTVVTHRTPPVCAQPRRRPSAPWIAANHHDQLMSLATAILPNSTRAALPRATVTGYLCSGGRYRATMDA
jgi:hypothetical protein